MSKRGRFQPRVPAEAGGRTGRWGALLRAGVKIRAIESFSEFKRQRRPRPLEVKRRRVNNNGFIGWDEYTVDPEREPAEAEGN